MHDEEGTLNDIKVACPLICGLINGMDKGYAGIGGDVTVPS